VEKYLNNHGRIFIVGRCPGWIDREFVTHIQMDDPYDNKLKNAMAKIMAACDDRRVTEEFILMNDDFIFLKKTDEIKSFIRGTLLAAEEEHLTRSGYYFKAIAKTRKILFNLGIKTDKNFEIHYPMMFEKTKFRDMEKQIDFKGEGLLFRSLYGNINNVGARVRSDFKLYDISELDELKSGEFISTDNRVVREPEFEKWIKRKFSERSKYERIKKALYYAKAAFFYGRQYNPGDVVEEEVPEQLKQFLTLA
jgi:hypothetical protein